MLIVGLGNPGTEYECTRHNIGFEAVDYLAEQWKIGMKKLKFKSIYGEGILNGHKIMLVKPTTYMNNSGESVRAFVDFYKMEPQNVLIIYDDMALPLGSLRIRTSGSDGGHNGIKSILYHLCDDQFLRVRIGIGEAERDATNHVLGRFSAVEIRVLEQTIQNLPDVLNLIVQGEVEMAMNKYNRKIKSDE